MRKYFISGVVAILLASILASIAAILRQWAPAVIFTHLSLIIAVLMIMLSARYIARTARTDARNARADRRQTRAAVEHLSGRIDQYEQATSESLLELGSLHRATQNALTDATKANHDSANELNKQVESLGIGLQNLSKQVKSLGTDFQNISRSTSRHITSTVRDSTRQIEAFAQIYSRFPETKLPMPSTGGFAIDSQALAHLIALVEDRRPKRILELGSGTSTIWLGYLAQRLGGQVVTLDHLEGYLELTQTAVNRHGLSDHVECRLAPLEKVEIDGEQYSWYALSALGDLDDVDLVVIDGPPAATGPKARYPALPNIIERLAPHATVILDDAHRQDESDIVDSWLSTFTSFEQIENGTSRLAVLERKQ